MEYRSGMNKALLSSWMADALTFVTFRSALFGNERFKPRSGALY